MGIQINGTTDSITAIDGSLSLSGAELATVSGVNVTGVVTATSYIVSAGSTSAPSISPSGDSNTGIFFPSADTIAFGEGGSEVARFDSSGRLGIGTVSPASGVTLHVNASGGGIVRVSRLSASASAYGQLEHDGTNSTLSSTAATIFVTNSSERARIDSSGNLLVGATSAPGGYSGNIILGTSGGGFYFNGSSAGTFGTSSNQAMVLATNAAERARIDSSGRLLVGTSTAGSSLTQTIEIHGLGGTATAQPCFENYAFPGTTADRSGYLQFYRSRGSSVGTNTIVASGDQLGVINFRGANGSSYDIAAQIRAEVDGTPGASNDMPGRLVFSTTADGASSPTERLRIQANGVLVKYGDSTSARIIPQTDNAGYIGQATARWEAIYAVNGTIQTSDEREKTEIQTSELGSDFIRSLRPVSYKWKVGGYTSTWDDEGKETITPNPGVRTHYGFIAQEVKQACGDTDFGGWLQEDLSDPESMQSLRLHEFISPIVKALQEALDEIDTLKAKVAALEAQ